MYILAGAGPSGPAGETSGCVPQDAGHCQPQQGTVRRQPSQLIPPHQEAHLGVEGVAGSHPGGAGGATTPEHHPGEDQYWPQVAQRRRSEWGRCR